MAVERQVTSGRERPAATVAEECNQYSIRESALTQVQLTIDPEFYSIAVSSNSMT